VNERTYRHRRQRAEGRAPVRPSRATGQPPRPHPASLTAAEKDVIIETLCSERFCDLAPAQVYSTLLDEGTYLCSERQMYRVLEERGLVRERRRGGHQRAGAYGVPRLEADAPNKVWTWDITALRGPTKGVKYYAVHDHRHLLSQGRGLVDPRHRVRDPRPSPHHRSVSPPRRRP
jgi:putative transposase